MVRKLARLMVILLAGTTIVILGGCDPDRGAGGVNVTGNSGPVYVTITDAGTPQVQQGDITTTTVPAE